MSNPKTHYRKVYKSDHLGVADLEDLLEAKSNMIFNIAQVRQEIGVRVAGKKGNHNIVHFKESIKPLCLNAGNAKILKVMASSAFVEDWAGLTIQLYIDPNVKFAGELTGGVRISPRVPVAVMPTLQPNTNEWQRAVNSFKQTGSLDLVRNHMIISDEHAAQLAKEASIVL